MLRHSLALLLVSLAGCVAPEEADEAPDDVELELRSVEVSPRECTFDRGVNDDVQRCTITIRNNGERDLIIDAVQVTGGCVEQQCPFRLASAFAPGTSIPPATSASIDILFTSSALADDAVLSIFMNDADESPTQVALRILD